MLREQFRLISFAIRSFTTGRLSRLAVTAPRTVFPCRHGQNTAPSLQTSFHLRHVTPIPAKVRVLSTSRCSGGPVQFSRLQLNRVVGGRSIWNSSSMGGGGSSSYWWNENLLYVIVGANVVVFMLWQNVRLVKFMNENFSISTRGILKEGRVHTLITSLFSHKDLMHLLANMVTLWFFGAEAMMLLGAQRFLNLFMFGGLTASACQVAWPLVVRQLPIPSQYRVSPHQQGLGASGAINAVVAYSILTFPNRTILLYFFLPVPAALLGALFLAKDVSGLYYGNSPYGNAAHLGGSLFGLLFWLRYRSIRPW